MPYRRVAERYSSAHHLMRPGTVGGAGLEGRVQAGQSTGVRRYSWPPLAILDSTVPAPTRSRRAVKEPRSRPSYRGAEVDGLTDVAAIVIDPVEHRDAFD